MYSLSSKDKKIVDKKFDRLHLEEKMSWITQSISYEYLVFVIWRTVHASEKSLERKRRVVVNIKNLNKIFMFDVYFLSLQSNVLFAMMKLIYISIINCVNFFHQWLVRILNRHKLIVINHRESEQWNVVVIRYRNFSTYVQRRIDVMLRSHRAFARAYVNDVMIFFNFLKEHLRHLNKIFKLFQHMNVAVKTSKIYLEYSFITLLNQKMNNLEFITTKNKLATIRDLQFSRTLKYLETYLNKTNYLK